MDKNHKYSSPSKLQAASCRISGLNFNLSLCIMKENTLRKKSGPSYEIRKKNDLQHHCVYSRQFCVFKGISGYLGNLHRLFWTGMDPDSASVEKERHSFKKASDLRRRV